MLVTIAKTPILTEANLSGARVVETPGGFAIEVKFDETGGWTLEQYSAANPGKHLVIFGQWGDKLADGRWLAAPLLTHRLAGGVLTFTPDASREEAVQLLLGLNNVGTKNLKQPVQMILARAVFAAAGWLRWLSLGSAQSPFQFPTANHALYEAGPGTEFFCADLAGQALDQRQLRLRAQRRLANARRPRHPLACSATGTASRPIPCWPPPTAR